MDGLRQLLERVADLLGSRRSVISRDKTASETGNDEQRKDVDPEMIAPEFDVEPLEAITVEPEIRGDSGSLFRLLFNRRVYARQLTAVEAHRLVGDILERAALPKRAATIPLESLNASNDE